MNTVNIYILFNSLNIYPNKSINPVMHIEGVLVIKVMTSGQVST